ncbi:MAG TPA: hypothetical protein PLA83_05040, partial [Deltaproteobacteria bacterium]|nr:hypothetical protein [Deltaproteobacteria bacterium]
MNRIFLSAFTAAFLFSVLTSSGILAAGRQAGGPGRPAAAANPQSFQEHQGRYFTWKAPQGWRASESNSGITLTSPDGRYAAALASIMRSQGTRTPEEFLQWVFTHVPDYKNARIVSLRKLPNQQMSYQTWKFVEAVVSYTDKGLPVKGVWKAGTANYYGMNDAMIVGYRAANEDFARARSFLPRIAGSIVLTNAAGANGINTLLKPRKNPLDNSALIKAGKNRDASRDRTSENWREGMMGTEPTYDPKTGRTYDSPLN